MPIIRLGRLEATHDRSEFECGDSELDDYLKLYAGQNQSRHQIGTTYVATEESQPLSVVGYYTLATTSIPTFSVGKPTGLKRLPYGDVPAVLLARLAVTRAFQNQGLGAQLLGDAVRRTLELAQVVGCRCLVVDAYPSAVPWYAKFGFVKLGSDPPESKTCKMSLDLRTAAKAATAALGMALRTRSSLHPPKRT